MVRILRIYSPNNFPVCHTVGLPAVVRLYIDIPSAYLPSTWPFIFNNNNISSYKECNTSDTIQSVSSATRQIFDSMLAALFII